MTIRPEIAKTHTFNFDTKIQFISEQLPLCADLFNNAIQNKTRKNYH